MLIHSAHAYQISIGPVPGRGEGDSEGARHNTIHSKEREGRQGQAAPWVEQSTMGPEKGQPSLLLS